MSIEESRHSQLWVKAANISLAHNQANVTKLLETGCSVRLRGVQESLPLTPGEIAKLNCTHRKPMRSFRSHRMPLCTCMIMCVACVSAGAHTCVCSCWWRPEVTIECLSQSLFHLTFGDRVSHYTWSSLMWLDRLVSDLCGVPASVSQSWAHRSMPLAMPGFLPRRCQSNSAHLALTASIFSPNHLPGRGYIC